MKLRDKVNMDNEQLIKYGPITIVAFGDSVTHGWLLNECNYETAYWNILKQKINKLRDFVPVNVINAGIGGMSAKRSLGRMDKQVLAYNPDLVIVCFGLNDVNGELKDYLDSLAEIFKRCTENGAEVIFMTPNMLNTYVDDNTPKDCLEYAKVTADFQNSGRMELYMEKAKELAEGMGIPVCDCYSKWKKLSETKDTTKLLANRINHPNPEMHKLFADSLYEIIFDDKDNVDFNCKDEDGMYKSGN